MSKPPQDSSNGRAAADTSGEHQAGTPTDHQERVSQEQTSGADALKIVADSRKTGSSAPLHVVAIVGSEQPAQPARAERPEHKPLARPELTAMADAIDQAANGGLLGIGTDKEAINEQLRRLRTPEERRLLDEIYRSKVGHGIEDELRDELSGSDLDKSLALWRSDNVDTARVEVALEEHKEWGFSARSNEICEKDIRDTVSTMNSTQIAAMDADYRARHDGVGIRDALMNDPNLSADTKAVLDIYLKGTDKRTDEDTRQLADIALKGKNLDMFNEVFRDASQSARDAFLEQGGRDKIMDAFGTPVGRGSGTRRIENEDTRHAMDYVRLGKLDVSTRVSDNTGVFNDNEAAIDQTLKTMTDAERQSYKDGRRLAESGSSRDSLSEADRTSLDYYTRIHDSLTRAGNEREVAKWEDLIDNQEGGLVTRLAAHGGFVDDSLDEVLGTIENMSEEDLARLKSDPDYLKRVREVLAIDLSEDEQKRANDLIDRKLEGGQRSITESIEDKTGFWNTNEEGIYDAIRHMTPEEQARYRDDEDFRKEVDGLVRSSLDYGREQDAAFELLDSIKKGENPENNIIARLHEHADHFNTDEARVVADLEKAFKDDPGLRDRIKNDPEHARRFNEAIHAALDPYEYQRYARPLIEDGRLPFKVKAELYNGVFDDDEKGLFQAIASGSPEDWKEIQDDPASVLPFLGESERQVAVSIASQNGEMRPEDKLRAAVIGMGTDVTAIKQVLESMSPAELQRVKDDYVTKYNSDLLGDLMSDEGGSIRELFVDRVGEQPQSDREAFNIASQRVYKSVDGVGRSLVDSLDGTADMSMDALNQYAAGMTQYSRRFEEMPADKRQELQENLMKAVELYRESESAAADTLVDGAIIAAGIGGAAFTGGVSLSLLACTTVGGALFKVGAKSVIIGNDYDFASTRMLADAATGGIDAATIFLGPAQFAQLAKLGKASAGTAARGVLSAADDLALASGRQILKEGASETLERKLFEQVAFAISNGSDSVDDKVISRLAREFAGSADDIPQVKQLIGKSLQEAVNAEASSAVKATARELALNTAAGNVGGGLSGMVYGATEWDASRSIGGNLAILGQQGFTGAAMGSGMAFGFTAGFKAVGRGLGALRHVDAPNGSVVDNAAADMLEDAGHAPKVVAATGALTVTEQAGARGLKKAVEEAVPGNLHAEARIEVGGPRTDVGESAPVDFSPERTEVGRGMDSTVSQPVPVEGNNQNFAFGDRVLVKGADEGILKGVDFETGEPIIEFPDREHFAVMFRPVKDISEYRPIKIGGHEYYRDQAGHVYSISDLGRGPTASRVHKYEIVDGKTISHAPPAGDEAGSLRLEPRTEPHRDPRRLPADRSPVEPPELPEGAALRPGEGYHSTGIYDGAYITVNGQRIAGAPSYDGSPLSLGRNSLGPRLDDYVSRDHAQIKWDPEQQMYFLEERSSNGTYLKRSGESEFQYLPGGRENPYRVYIGPSDTVRLGNLEGPEIRLNVPDSSLNANLRPKVGPSGDVDVRVFFDGKPLHINDDGEMMIGRVHQQVGAEGLSDLLDRRVASNHAKLSFDESAGKWKITDLTGARRSGGGDYTGTVMVRQGGNGTFIRREGGRVDFIQGESAYLGPNDSVHLGSPDGPELKFITNPGHRLADGRVEVPRKNFDMAVKRPDGTTEITTFLNFRRLEDPQGRVIQVLDPRGRRRGFDYDSEGALQRMKFDDESVVERTAGDVWVRTTPDGRSSEFFRGDIEIEPDGAIKFRDPGEPPAYTIDRVDGTREIVHSNGRVEYRNVDFSTELGYMNAIMNSFPNNGQRSRFKQMMNDFERRAAQDGLSAQEKALTFHHVRRLYQAEYGAFLTAPERSHLAEQIFYLASHPEKVCQGANSTCNVSTLERRLFAKNPSEAVRLISDVVITGKYVTANGVKVDLGRIPGVLAPDSEARMLAKGFSPDGADLKIDGRRTYASQIFETTAVNLNWAQSAEYKIKPGDMVVYEKVPGPVTGSGTEELVRYSVGSMGNLKRDVVKNSPHIYVSDLEPLYRQITGGTDGNFVLWHNSRGGSIKSADDLRRSIERIEREGGPGVIMVHTRNEPFWTDSGGGVAGGSGGWHVVNIEGIRQDPRTGRYLVDITNQWDDAAHHTGDRAIPLDQLFESMKKPDFVPEEPAVSALAREVIDARPPSRSASLDPAELRARLKHGSTEEQVDLIDTVFDALAGKGPAVADPRVSAMVEIVERARGLPSNVSIPYRQLLRPDTRLEVLEFYYKVMPDLRGQAHATPSYALGGHKAEDQIGRAISYALDVQASRGGRMKDWIFIPSEAGSAADAFKMDGALLNVSTGKIVPMDIAMNEKALMGKAYEQMPWAFTLTRDHLAGLSESEVPDRIASMLEDFLGGKQYPPSLMDSFFRHPGPPPQWPVERFSSALGSPSIAGNSPDGRPLLRFPSLVRATGRTARSLDPVDELTQLAEQAEVMTSEGLISGVAASRIKHNIETGAVKHRRAEVGLSDNLARRLDNLMAIKELDGPVKGSVPGFELGTETIPNSRQEVSFLRMKARGSLPDVEGHSYSEFRIYDGGFIIGVLDNGQKVELGTAMQMARHLRSGMDRVSSSAEKDLVSLAGLVNLKVEPGSVPSRLASDHAGLQVLAEVISRPPDIVERKVANLTGFLSEIRSVWPEAAPEEQRAMANMMLGLLERTGRGIEPGELGNIIEMKRAASSFGIELSDGEALLWSRIRPGVDDEILEDTLKSYGGAVAAMDRTGYYPDDVFDFVLGIEPGTSAKDIQIAAVQAKLKDMAASGNTTLARLAEDREALVAALTRKGNVNGKQDIRLALKNELSAYGLSDQEVASRVDEILTYLKEALR